MSRREALSRLPDILEGDICLIKDEDGRRLITPDLNSDLLRQMVTEAGGTPLIETRIKRTRKPGLLGLFGVMDEVREQVVLGYDAPDVHRVAAMAKERIDGLFRGKKCSLSLDGDTAVWETTDPVTLERKYYVAPIDCPRSIREVRGNDPDADKCVRGY
jgi:hypothetical protein